MNTEISRDRVILDLRTRLAAAERSASIWKWITLVLLFGPAVLTIFLLALG
ncbi:MAG: hypothetical protein AB1544_05640 [Pseudomonadota bacterium]|jgi:hypothetical protein